MILSAQQVAQLALAAGFETQRAVVAVAIAQAESGFNDQAVGDVALQNDYWGPSVGLWQIRTLKFPSSPYRTKDWLLQDPANQAKAAFVISSGGADFSPWSTYKNGAYKRYMEGAVRAVNSSIPQEENPQMPTVAAAFPYENGYVIVLTNGAVYAFGCTYHGGLSIAADGTVTAHVQ